MPSREDLLTLCSALADAGIWLSLNATGGLTVGPRHLVERHDDLIAQVRAVKADLMAVLEATLVHDLFLTKGADPRFAQETCPECQQLCYIVSPPRRLTVHRVPDGQTVCPGSDQAQRVAADAIMEAFLDDGAIERRMAVLTWVSLKTCLESWCRERGLILPSRPFLVAYMDAHFERHGDDERPRWAGLTLTLQEWGLADESPAASTPPQPLTLIA